MGEHNRRNLPCHCGSGKKYKNCCLSKDSAPRMQGYVFTAKESGWVTEIEFGPGGQARLLSGDQPFPVSDVKVAEWRETEKGLKRNSEIDVPDSQAFVHPEAVLEDVKYVFGVDTNQIEVNGINVNISCLTCATRQIKTENFEGSIQQIMAIDFIDTGYSAERIGWIIAVESLRRSGWDGASKVVICTDHDVNSHTAINQQTQSIIEDYNLPPNITLMYARDRGSSIPNKLIAAAHKGATAVARILKEAPGKPQNVLPDLLGKVPRGGLRIWNSEAYYKYFDPKIED